MNDLSHIVKTRGQRWFAHCTRQAEDGWLGPHDTIEEAIREGVCEFDIVPIFVGLGRRVTKAEREEFGTEFDWQVDAPHAIEVRLP